MLGEVPEGKLVSLVSVLEFGQLHVAILARAMGIPTVMGLVDLPYSRSTASEMIVDGYHGESIPTPAKCCASNTPKWWKNASCPRASTP